MSDVDRARRTRLILAQLRGEDTSNRRAAPVREHLNALHDLGWSWEAIAGWHNLTNAEVSGQALRMIASGDQPTVHRRLTRLRRIPLTYAVPPDLPGHHFVPSAGATRRVRALLALGWRHEDILGPDGHIHASGTRPRTTADRWRAADAAYRRLCITPGTSTKTRTRAQRLGYAPPLAWDDIDDPREQPADWQYRVDAGTRRDTFDELVDRGAALTEVLTVLGIGFDALEKWCDRHGLRHDFNRLTARERGVA